MYKGLIGVVAALGLSVPAVAVAQQPKTLKVVAHSDLKILDPIWTTAFIVRNHGYMIYDTLFALDGELKIKPQMVDTWKTSDDQLTWTFTLRDGLEFHDGQPVTTEDVIASLKRWAVRDSLGQILWSKMADIKAVDAKTFQIVLKAPTGIVLQALGKPSGNPFIMPKRVAETPATDQIKEFVGSGPFIFKADEWKPGDRTVYVKNPKYKPRPEPASGLAGGKIPKVDRVEWVAIPDQQTAVNALQAGEIDIIEAPQHDLYPLIKKDRNVSLVTTNKWGNQYIYRFNQLHKPFDNAKNRQAMLYALNQKDFLNGVIGDPEFYTVCKAMFMCGGPYETTAGFADKYESDFAKAKQLLAEGGYDNTPVVLLHSTDLYVLTNMAPIAKSLMEKAGMKVDMQSMDWQTLVARRAKKDPPDKGGWNVLITSTSGADSLDPLTYSFISASCDKAWFGWPCDAEITRLRDAFADETDEAKRKQIVEKLQLRAAEVPTHAFLGQYNNAMAIRKNVSGSVVSPVPVFWNIEKK
ncbi:ABC transporter substrate-binding protein [Reyranella aquatilis]|uniref:ABC transporter substrate-binding protein n=1 Tax=Reyranella aquatilis TaxID=2035356 RepID=A0ABS8KSX4_9HYPH|nr:ABC transporter substrate-binding protein [Reyranella aquatilis]MCC8428763.1 ABC transporter substrate-binding protein [Reyranella aquatilis]